MSDNETQIALLKQSMEFQNKEITEIKKILIDFIDSAEKKFATKEDHLKNVEEIKAIKNTHEKLMWSFLGTFGSFVIGLVVFILKKIGVM